MAVTYEYKSQEVLQMSSIIQASEACKKNGRNFSTVIDCSINFEMNPKVLPVFDQSKYGELVSPFVTGVMNSQKDPYPAFKEVLLAAQKKKLGDYSKVDVTVKYEALGCKQNRRDYNSIGLIYDDDKLLFTYSDRTISKVKEEGYHRKVFERLISAGNLPLTIEDVGGQFKINHCEGGRLAFGLAKRKHTGEWVNPKSLQCELVNESIDSALSRVQTVLPEVSSGKIFSYEWFVGYKYHENGPATSADGLGGELYNLVVDQGFPAKSYTITGFLDSATMEGVEFIRQICGPKDHADIPIFACQHPHERDGYLNAGVHIKPSGYELMVESSDPIDALELSQFLGIEVEAARDVA